MQAGDTVSTFTLLGLEQLSVTINLVVAVFLGAVIGLERQFVQRYTGVTTHALVALGAAAFVSIASLASPVGDVSRIAGQVVTGIGFLGAGLIFRDGMSVRGLSAAASIWATGAVGALSGFGFLLEATEVALLMFIVNLTLPRIGRLVDRLAGDDQRHRPRRPRRSEPKDE
ncbi:MgtC/SapB family protein [Acuticoccus sediminis]|uniref:MgtC/SapB family protein n=1 Tax=Acuticoccus sediminis TaxID=2184697 RepID=UPI001CFF3578|nr:MgtC/SapB family protein [Acuticoccus sediminis]